MKNLPKLGRPFKGGSPRNRYVKFYLTESEFISLEHMEENVKIYYLALGLNYNRSDHFRLILSKLDNNKILSILFDDPIRKNPILSSVLGH